IGINIILVAGLNLVNGYLGEFAIGHAGFMAVGAYLSSVVTVLFHQPYALALIVGSLGAALVGFLVGIPSFRTFGDYLAIITLGFNMIIVNVIQNINLIGGPRGFGGMPKETNLLVVGCLTILVLAVLRHLIYSNYGRIWIAIRENDLAAELMGVDIVRYKLLAFTIAAGLAGLAGGLSAHLIQYIHPSTFTYIKTTDVLVMLYLGGMGSLSGSILGATVLTVLLELLRPLGVWRMVLSPLILVAIMLSRPHGIMGHREFAFLAPREEVRQRESA
ncbi:MAG: branched-chain amino acid ABC transporter permease, partial [Bacillota bacterium]|nr:branched-chain amino acid ABC transporter permease [Bacillota bacterium]